MIQNKLLKTIAFLYVLACLGCGTSSPPKQSCQEDEDCPKGQMCRDELCVAGTIPEVPQKKPETPDSGQPPIQENPDAGQVPSSPDAGTAETDAGSETDICGQGHGAGISPECDDGDPCTINDQCIDDVCVGETLICENPPETYCSDATTLVTYGTYGMCQNGNCIYTASDQICDKGCNEDACSPTVHIKLHLKTHPSVLMESGLKAIRARLAPTVQGQMNSTSWGLQIRSQPH